MLTRQRALSAVIRVAAAVSLIGVAATAQPVAAIATACTGTTAPTSGSGLSWLAVGTWSTNLVPTASDDVCLPAGSEIVEVDITTAAVAKSITIGAGAKLVVKGSGSFSDPPTTLTVTNNVTNAGTIQIGTGTASHAQASLNLTSGTLTNTGTIVTAGFGNNLNANLDNQASGTVNDAFPLGMAKVNGVISNSGTWTVNGQTDIGNVQSFTMAAGTVSGSAIFHVAGGIFDHTGGTVTATTHLENVVLKPEATSGSATVKVVGVSSTLGSNISANDTVVIEGGFVSTDGLLNSSADWVNNGTIRLSSSSASKTAKLLFAAGKALTNNGTIETASGSGGNARVISANLINNGTMNINYDTDFVQASATLIQNSGTTTIQKANVLDPDPTLDLTGSAGTFDLAGGMLKGTGALTGQLQNDGGTVAPGSSPGVLTVTGNFTQAAGGTLAMEIGGTTAGSESDRLVVTGSASLAGTLALTPIFSFVPDLSFDYDFLTYGSLGGDFTTVTGTNAGGGKTYVVSHPASAMKLTVVAAPVTRQPDGQIALGSGSFSGNNIYNADGTSQSKSKTATAGTKVTFSIKIQNDGTGAKDKFKVHATGAAATGYTIVCKKGTTNITTAVVNGTYTTGKIAVGASITIKCSVTIGSTATHGSHVDRLITLTSFNDAAQKDAVKLTVGRT